ncbi:UDP-2,3-diacylglucosamine diphosphatase [Shewanella waksmanii]|uniref:UDP-2,3-diacylglucosamine diphosphatase n=1 Tax=Shewanella waksmanii TaxID=213783 RepID=UPI003735F845
MSDISRLLSSLFDASSQMYHSPVTQPNIAGLQGSIVKQRFNAIWISDLHLGSKDCKAELLLDFLAHTQIDTLYLVGDIVDVWALKKQLYWPQSHHLVLQTLQSMAKNGTQVIYVPGNHDELLKQYYGLHLWGFKVESEVIHTTKQQQKLLVLHGDQFDSQVSVGASLTKLGDKLYDLLLFLNRQLHQVRQHMGYPYWSLASFIKQHVAKAQQAIGLYRNAVIRYGRDRGVDGVICGHIHQPELSLNDGFIYANDGDWVENCTLFAENHNGELQLLRWNEASHTTELISSLMQSSQQRQRQVA